MTDTTTLTQPVGAPKSSPTATAAATGNGASAAPNASPVTAAPSATLTTSARRSTGNASAKRKPPPTRAEVLEIWQQATLNLRLAGFDLTVHALEDKQALVLVLAGVSLHAGQFILAK